VPTFFKKIMKVDEVISSSAAFKTFGFFAVDNAAVKLEARPTPGDPTAVVAI
jgi:hypothetical protein